MLNEQSRSRTAVVHNVHKPVHDKSVQVCVRVRVRVRACVFASFSPSQQEGRQWQQLLASEDNIGDPAMRAEVCLSNHCVLRDTVRPIVPFPSTPPCALCAWSCGRSFFFQSPPPLSLSLALAPHPTPTPFSLPVVRSFLRSFFSLTDPPSRNYTHSLTHRSAVLRPCTQRSSRSVDDQLNT